MLNEKKTIQRIVISDFIYFKQNPDLKVQQAMGCTRGKSLGAAYLKNFVEEMKSTGFVGQLIEKHEVVGRLSVAGPA